MVCNLKKARLEQMKDRLQALKDRESQLVDLSRIMTDALVSLQQEVQDLDRMIQQAQSARSGFMEALDSPTSVFEQAKSALEVAAEKVVNPNQGITRALLILGDPTASVEIEVNCSTGTYRGRTLLQDAAALTSRFFLSGEIVKETPLAGKKWGGPYPAKNRPFMHAESNFVGRICDEKK